MNKFGDFEFQQVINLQNFQLWEIWVYGISENEHQKRFLSLDFVKILISVNK